MLLLTCSHRMERQRHATTEPEHAAQSEPAATRFACVQSPQSLQLPTPTLCPLMHAPHQLYFPSLKAIIHLLFVFVIASPVRDFLLIMLAAHSTSYSSFLTNILHSQPGSQSAFAAIGGYCVPSFSTLGVHVHQDSLSILSMTRGM